MLPPARSQVALALSKLRTGASDRVVGMLVGIPAGSVSLFAKEGLSLIAQALRECNALPTLTLPALLQARHTFASTPAIAGQKYRLGNCIGALDGWVTCFVGHGGDRSQFWNYKHSQIALNNLLLFDGAPRPRVLWASLGFPGRWNDPGCMLDCDLGRAIYQGDGPLADVIAALSDHAHSQRMEFVDAAGRLRRRDIAHIVYGKTQYIYPTMPGEYIPQPSTAIVASQPRRVS